MIIPEIKFPFWMNGGEIAKFARAMRSYWQRLIDVIAIASNKENALTAPLSVLNLIAWERSIEPLTGETEALYRIRIANAFKFTRWAGENYGSKQILQIYGFTDPQITQRFDTDNWDVIRIVTNTEEFNSLSELLGAMIQTYRRTCKRYEFENKVGSTLNLYSDQFSGSYSQHIATANISTNSKINIRVYNLDLNKNTYIAKLS